jgi:hypothetical protein
MGAPGLTNGNGLNAANIQPAETHTKTNIREFSNKSTATKAQYDRLLTMLRTGPKNTTELRRGGVMMPAARIKELNDRHGAYIPTVDTVELTDEWGFSHRGVAVYELIDEPTGVCK